MNKKILNIILATIMSIGLASCSNGSNNPTTGTIEAVPSINEPSNNPSTDESSTNSSTNNPSINPSTEEESKDSTESSTTTEQKGPRDDIEDERVRKALKYFSNESKQFDFNEKLEALKYSIKVSYSANTEEYKSLEVDNGGNISTLSSEYIAKANANTTLGEIHIESTKNVDDNGKKTIERHNELRLYKEDKPYIYDYINHKKYIAGGTIRELLEINPAISNDLIDLESNYDNQKFYIDDNIYTFVGEIDNSSRYKQEIYQIEDINGDGIYNYVYYTLEKTNNNGIKKTETEFRISKIGAQGEMPKKEEYKLDPYKRVSLYFDMEANTPEFPQIGGTKENNNYGEALKDGFNKIMSDSGYTPSLSYYQDRCDNKTETGVLIGSLPNKNYDLNLFSNIASNLTINVDSFIDPSKPSNENYTIFRDIFSLEDTIAYSLLELAKDGRIFLGGSFVSIGIMPLWYRSGDAAYNLINIDSLQRKIDYLLTNYNESKRPVENKQINVELLEKYSESNNKQYDYYMIDLSDESYSNYVYDLFEMVKNVIDISYIRPNNGHFIKDSTMLHKMKGEYKSVIASIRPNVEREMYLVKKIIDYEYLNDDTLTKIITTNRNEYNKDNIIYDEYENIYYVPFKALINESFEPYHRFFN